MTIRAHFDGKVLIPHGPIDVPLNQEITLEVQTSSAVPPTSEKDLLALFAEMDADSVNLGTSVDYSREGIYSGTVDDPR